MQTFKQYFTEALNLSTAKKYTKMGDYKDYRNDVFKGNDRIILPDEIKPDTEVVDENLMRDVSAYLTFFGFGFLDMKKDYIAGIAYPRKAPDYNNLRNLKFSPAPRVRGYQDFAPDGKNKFKIGKVLTKIINYVENTPEDTRIAYLDDYKNTLQRYITDPFRTKVGVYKIIISRHPYDIAGMSTDRMWSSCMNLGDPGKVYKKEKKDPGQYSHMIPEYIKKNGLIAYLVPKDEINMQSGKCKLHKPLSRLSIFPHEGRGGDIAYGLGRAYGISIPEFSDIVERFIDTELNPETIEYADDYKSPMGVYRDEGTSTPSIIRTRMRGKQIFDAVERNDVEKVYEILNSGVHPDKLFFGKAPNKRTPLMLAAERGFDKIVDALIKAGAHPDPNYSIYNNYSVSKDTPVGLALSNGHKEVAKELAKYTIDMSPVWNGPPPGALEHIFRRMGIDV